MENSNIMKREHGGPDALGAPRWDFSANTNACGPCPVVEEAVRMADATRYPDPDYTELRSALAAFHGVDASRIVFGTSASELITRLTACLARGGARHVWQPALAYGDYAHAAKAWHLEPVAEVGQADLLWLCEPSSPLGMAEGQTRLGARPGCTVIIDRVYEPLRLSGQCGLTEDDLNAMWQLWSPNKAMGLTGVRGAYAIAPVRASALVRELDGMAASWPLGAHGVAMLLAWTTAEAQQWLVLSRQRMKAWKQKQVQMLEQMGWVCMPSMTSYFCARAPGPVDQEALRELGVKLRDTRSLGLPGYWRLSVQPPAGQEVLRTALMRRRERVT
jgi:histidinol-phosphate aminotransferase